MDERLERLQGRDKTSKIQVRTVELANASKGKETQLRTKLSFGMRLALWEVCMTRGLEFDGGSGFFPWPVSLFAQLLPVTTLSRMADRFDRIIFNP